MSAFFCGGSSFVPSALVRLTRGVVPMLPSGKGIYMRMDSLYPGDPVEYVRALGCTFAAVLPTDIDRVPRLRMAGIDPWVWSGPSDWQPGNAVRSAERICALARDAGCVGVIPDPEGPTWGDSPDAALRMADALAEHQGPLSVVITSFPNLISRVGPEWASRGAGLSPQVYHGVPNPPIASRVYSAEQRNRWVADAAKIAGGGAGPSVGAWGRSATDQKVYLESFAKPMRFALYWHTNAPTVGSGLFKVLRDWEPGFPKALKILALVTVLLTVAVVVYLMVRSGG